MLKTFLQSFIISLEQRELGSVPYICMQPLLPGEPLPFIQQSNIPSTAESFALLTNKQQMPGGRATEGGPPWLPSAGCQRFGEGAAAIWKPAPCDVERLQGARGDCQGAEVPSGGAIVLHIQGLEGGVGVEEPSN